VIAAQALQRHDLSLFEKGGRTRDVVVAPLMGQSAPVGGAQKGQLGTAFGTGDRLSMKTAIGRIVVLGQAPGAHLKGQHRRVGPIVGNPGGDRKARSAVGAVGEGIAVAALGPVVDLHRAHLTGRNVRRNRDRGGPIGPAVEYLEVFAARHRDG
jgi:hypothetical protein